MVEELVEELELALELDLALEVLELALELVQAVSALGCLGNQHCYCKPYWDPCCRDHLCHLEGRFHKSWHHPTYSSNTWDQRWLQRSNLPLPQYAPWLVKLDV